MHRHGYKGRKLSRKRDQRGALIKQLASQLIDHGAITTTTPKAKEVLPYVEKLITSAKQATLAGRRQVIAGVYTLETAYKLFDEIAPQLTKRNSGHLRLKKSGTRRGDNADMAEISFVDTLLSKPSQTATLTSKPTPKKPTTKPKATPAPRSVAPQVTKQVATAAKRTGRRGDK